MNNKNTIEKGFTLVELLIAISLIAILSGVLFSVLNPMGIQKQTRDSQRVSDLAKIKVALENYFFDNRAYPVQANWVIADTLPLTEANPYINIIPRDPKETGNVCDGSTLWRRYAYRSSDGKTYALATNMETNSMGSQACPLAAADCCAFKDGTGYYTTAD